MVDLFGRQQSTGLQLFSLDQNLLGSYYNARVVSHTVNAIQNATYFPTGRGPAVLTPWDVAEGNKRSLIGQYNAIRNKTDFIDLKSDLVRKVSSNPDQKALFALYTALSDLKTIADYTAHDNTPEALIARLNTQFRGGFSQVQDYVKGLDLDKLTLLYGKKEPRVTTDVALGKNQADIIGASLKNTFSRTQVIPGLTGNEVFTINIDKTTVNDDIVVDLSTITGDITLNSLVSHINQQINAVTTLDPNGNTVTQYKSKFVVEEIGPKEFALKLDSYSGEKITLSAAVEDPALYITGSTKDLGLNQTETASLTRLAGLNTAAPTTELTQQVAGIDASSLLPPLKDEDGNDIISDPEALQTTTAGSAVDSQGNVYVVGNTVGDVGGQVNAATNQDVFLTKYDASGNVLFSRLLGASDTAQAFDIAIDGSDNVIIAGQVNEELKTSDVFSGYDSFVTKYDNTGEELWTYQQDTVAKDQANAIAIDANGDIFVTGQISGRLNATTTAGGGTDTYVAKLDGTSGSLTAATQIGGAGTEYGEAIAIANDGNILIASREDGVAVVRKLDAANLGTEITSFSIGSLGGGAISDIAVDATGGIYVSGTSQNASLAGGGTIVNAHQGGSDGFVTRLSDGGASLSADWTNFVGTSSTDQIEGLTVQNGSVFVAGKTSGTFAGEIKTGSTDGFAAKIDAVAGATIWTEQLKGSKGYNGSSALAFSATGSSVLTKLGLPTGLYDNKQSRDIETQTSARTGDYFYIAVNGGAAKKITLKEGDTFDTLAKRINLSSFRYIKASQTIGSNGPELKIESKLGATLQIFAGDQSKDALKKLGLEPAKILPADQIFSIGDDSLGTDPDNLGGIFALELLSGFSLRSKKEAEYVSAQLTTSIETIQRAFRSLTYDPVKAQILKDAKLKGAGPAPAYLQSRLANYQDALSRLQGL